MIVPIAAVYGEVDADRRLHSFMSSAIVMLITGISTFS